MNERSPSTFSRLPRAIRWAIIAAICIVVFLVLDEYIWTYDDEWQSKADDIQQLLEDAQRRPTRLQSKVRHAIYSYGEVSFDQIERETLGRAKLNKAVADILKNHVVSNDTMNDRPGGNLPQEVLREHHTPATDIARYLVEVKFDASPEVAMDIIADLEAHPDIESISQVSMIKHENRSRVQVNLKVESWIITDDEKRTR